MAHLCLFRIKIIGDPKNNTYLYFKIDNMFFFYSRVSTTHQNTDRQKENFKVHGGFSPQNHYSDKVTGNTPFLQRPEALKLFEAAHSMEKSTVVVDSIDRLGRNLIDILKTIELFTKAGINLKSLKEGFETLKLDGTENPATKVLISVMGSLAELERNRLKERQSEGIKIAKANGKYRGRKAGSVLTRQQILQKHGLVAQKLSKGLTVRDVAQLTGHSTTTVVKVKKALAA